MSLAAFLDRLNREERWASCIAAWKTVPAQEAITAPIPGALDPRLRRALIARGVDELYVHQADAFDAVITGNNTVVVTPTASGKTLCYNLPVLNHLLSEPTARAMYLFPTKALAQDQYAGLQALLDAAGADIKTWPYDGDTPAAERRLIRQAGHIIITNPDMLHSAILPHHTKWHALFENLKYVVIDEMHGYRGVFGSHVANVIRRLKRICRHYGSSPRFILASATIANPGELAEKLIELPVEVITRNGAPRGRKDFILYNPPVVNRALGIRRSAILEASGLASELIRNDIHTIVFARARVTAEVLLTYLREALPPKIGQSNAIRGYRGGYLPNQRREIEAGLRDGRIKGVVSTNALELGVDIGSLDAAVMTGYPGTIASAWQQAGRAGRRESMSAAIMVASSSPIDQFIVNHPEYFFEGSPENGLINPDNLLIVVNHIKCAAFELPFKRGEMFGTYEPTDALDYLAEIDILHYVNNTWHWMSDSYPAEDLSLRTAARENVVIIEKGDGRPRVIGEVDAFSAPMLVHTDAIYIHDGQQYHVDELDWEEKKAYVKPVDVEHYTDASLSVRVEVIEQFSDGDPAAERHHGEVLVGAIVTQFKKIRMHTHENLGWGKVFLPESQMHTSAYWTSLPAYLSERMAEPVLHGALSGLANLLGNIAPVYLMCDPRDLGVYAQVRAPFTGAATVFIYDKVPGGIGFSEKLYEAHHLLLKAALDHVTRCPCQDGCPSCVGVRPSDESLPFAKKTTRQLLEVLHMRTPRSYGQHYPE
ncbi:MAG TPA: DEAD/DEAH box helicase [Thermomicrobiales bacterium]|nr:DEAD/DEAH box helicase [Thermomicrobiales bacterium]